MDALNEGFWDRMTDEEKSVVMLGGCRRCKRRSSGVVEACLTQDGNAIPDEAR